MAITIDTSTITVNSGAVMADPPGTAGLFFARAWVNFNGTGTPAVVAGGNASTITDHAAGDYTVNFTTAMSDINYAVAGAGSGDGGGSAGVGFSNESRTTAGCRVRLFLTTTANGLDVATVMVVIFR